MNAENSSEKKIVCYKKNMKVSNEFNKEKLQNQSVKAIKHINTYN